MRILRDFFDQLDFISMTPAPSLLRRELPKGYVARALAKVGDTYAIYVAAAPVKASNYSVRWSGTVEAPQTETFTFHTLSNDGVRLWVDGKLVIDNWTNHGVTENTGQVALSRGKRLPVKMEYYQASGGAVARLLWSSRTIAKQVVPANALRSGEQPGLRGEYFEDENLKTLAFTRRNARSLDRSGTLATRIVGLEDRRRRSVPRQEEPVTPDGGPAVCAAHPRNSYARVWRRR
jgi:hypothetical protein